MILAKYGDKERNLVINHFFEKIYRIVQVENHVHKYKGEKQLEVIFKAICERENYEISLKWDEYKNRWEIIGSDTLIVYTLPELFYHFKSAYRFQR